MLFLRTPYSDDKLFHLIPPFRSSWETPGRNVGDATSVAQLRRTPDSSNAPDRIKLASANEALRSNHYKQRYSPSGTFCDVSAGGKDSAPGRLEGLYESREIVRKSDWNKRLSYWERVDPQEFGRSIMPRVQTNGLNGAHSSGANGERHFGDDESITSPIDNQKIQTDLESIASPTSSGSTPRSAHSRKESNPLAPPFIVSAPGKVIVYGEHAVVHGKAAIAAAISLRSYLLVTTLSKSKRTVTLRFTDIGLDHTWHIQDLPWKAFAHPSRRKKYYDMVTSLDKELVEAMQSHIDCVSPNEKKPEKRKIHQAAASTFLYLFLSLGSESSSPCIYALRSTIPIGAGLGSSASISVCLSAALLLQCRALAGPHPDQMSKEAEEQLERINRWAFVGELLIHGNPSGVDNTVATNGRAVLFQRRDYSKPPSVQIMREFPELPLLLVDTCQPKSTAAEVAKVGRLKEAHPAVTNSILDSIDAITRSVHDCIEGEDFDPQSPDSIRHLGELMSVNHGLLSSLGVSHPKLERLRYLVDQAGVGWTKLTGAGGGGCAITLLRLTKAATNGDAQLNGDAAHEASSDSSLGLQALEKALEAEGFQKYKTTLGGDGVGVLYPAVVGEEEIDQDLFLSADGREGVEALVGSKSGCDAWKYWRP